MQAYMNARRLFVYNNNVRARADAIAKTIFSGTKGHRTTTTGLGKGVVRGDNLQCAR